MKFYGPIKLTSRDIEFHGVKHDSSPCVFGLANNIMVWIKMLDTGLTHLLGSIMRHSDSFKSKGLVAVPVGNEPSKCRLYISIIKEKKEAHWDF